MLRALRNALRPSENRSLAPTFLRVGWVGFWMQVVIGAVPVTLTTYAFVFGASRAAGTRSGFPLIQYLTVVSLLVLAFTTIWFYRYTRLSVRLVDPAKRPTALLVQKTVLTGVVASTLGIVFSMLVLFLEVAQLWLYFLRAPQAGVPVIQTTAGQASWVSASDILHLLALLLSMFIEIAVLVIGLWLLVRAMTPSIEFPHVGDEDP